ncbi:hypothetical protein PENSTE_c006G03953 [Penicillium steckii]|uniref:F-box domain-containing protein n=1 Tax=Penicillium steckii TaxID=303698 RepID=A0A1V6TH82_9EURO|nr:hypothetical protein PENSTE_c006G03953 [Penicillium steckii]
MSLDANMETETEIMYPNKSDRTLYCCVCSLSMLTGPSWLSKYLALYRTETGTKTSEVNVVESDWDLFFGLNDVAKEALAPILGRWFMMTAIKPQKVVLFHKFCWLHLLQHFEGEDINLDRLFEVCRQANLYIVGRDWAYADLENGHLEIPKPEYIGARPPFQENLQVCTGRDKQNPTLMYPSSTTNGPTSTDCFCFLPMEMNLAIAMYLDTVSFFQLRYVSRAMAKVFIFNHSGSQDFN